MPDLYDAADAILDAVLRAPQGDVLPDDVLAFIDEAAALASVRSLPDEPLSPDEFGPLQLMRGSGHGVLADVLQYAWTKAGGTSKTGKPFSDKRYINEQGTVRYFDAPPQERKTAAPKPAPAPRPAKATEQDVADALSAINAADVTPEMVQGVAGKMATMTIAQLHTMRKALKVKGASGLRKGSLADELVKHVKGERPVPARKKATPASAQAQPAPDANPRYKQAYEALHAILGDDLHGHDLTDIEGLKAKLEAKRGGANQPAPQRPAEAPAAKPEPAPIARPEVAAPEPVAPPQAPAVHPEAKPDDRPSFKPASLPKPSDDPHAMAPSPYLPDFTRPALEAGEKDALERYSEEEVFRDLNSALYKGGQPSDPDIRRIHENLQKAFAKSPPMDKPVNVYRGIDMKSMKSADKATFLRKLEKAANGGGEIQLPGYQSTTTDEKLARSDFGFGKQNQLSMTIAARHGLDVKPYAVVPEEWELLLNHNSKFRVKSFKNENGSYHVELEQTVDEPAGRGEAGAGKPVHAGRSSELEVPPGKGAGKTANAQRGDAEAGGLKQSPAPVPQELPAVKPAAKDHAATTHDASQWSAQEKSDAERSRAEQTPVYSEPRPSPERLAKVQESVQEAMKDAPKDASGMVNIPALRNKVDASRREFDDALRGLRRDDKVRLVAAGLLAGKHSPEDILRGVPGERETFMHVEPVAPDHAATTHDAVAHLGKMWDSGPDSWTAEDVKGAASVLDGMSKADLLRSADALKFKGGQSMTTDKLRNELKSRIDTVHGLNVRSDMYKPVKRKEKTPEEVKTGHQRAVMDAVEELHDRHPGGLIPLHALQQETGLSREQLHDAIRPHLGKTLTGTTHEARGKTDPKLAQAAMDVGGTNPIHYVSRKQEQPAAEQPQPPKPAAPAPAPVSPSAPSLKPPPGSKVVSQKDGLMVSQGLGGERTTLIDPAHGDRLLRDNIADVAEVVDEAPLYKSLTLTVPDVAANIQRLHEQRTGKPMSAGDAMHVVEAMKRHRLIELHKLNESHRLTQEQQDQSLQEKGRLYHYAVPAADQPRTGKAAVAKWIEGKLAGKGEAKPPTPAQPATPTPGPSPAPATASHEHAARARSLYDDMAAQMTALGRAGHINTGNVARVRADVESKLDEMQLASRSTDDLRAIAKNVPGAEARGGKGEMIDSIRRAILGPIEQAIGGAG